MLISIISMVLLGSLAAYMTICAKFEVTRRFAMIPGTMCLIETIVAGVLEQATHPILTSLLLLTKLTILCLGVYAMKRDRVNAQKRSERRRAFRRKLLCAQNPIHIVKQSAPTIISECA